MALTLNATHNEIVQNDEDFRFRLSLKEICDVATVCTLIVIMLSMGTDITFKEIIAHLKMPLGIVAGMVCQFIIMPLLGFSLSQALSLEGQGVLGLLLISCCPGGALSNVFAYYMDGDVPLSVTMTSMSTLLALGFMPFNLWLYGHWVKTGNLVIPFKSMATSLASVTIPAGIGILFRWKYKKFAGYVTKIGSFLGLFMVFLVTVLYNVAFPTLLKEAPWRYCVAVVVMPCIGFLIGYAIAFFFKRKTEACKTVAIESSIQNVAVAFGVLAMSPFTYEEHRRVSLFPMMYGISMISMGILVVSVYQIWTRFCRKYSQKESEKDGLPNIEMDLKVKDQQPPIER